MNDLKIKGWTTIGSRKKGYGKIFFAEMKKFYPYKSLANIFIPTLIIHGTNDDKVSYNDTKEYVRSLKKGRLITIKDGEHGFQDRESDRRIVKEETLNFFLKYLK
ncbi:hypothetical protein A2767_01020 [Candidatus Roizmanbacteria bacterium RIFCSPHIGHO2_01_FULL_35_10]|uniref:Peptidase S9 prolyl oligopeptidase catalytic domain-containing protein n=1 Tax=Candidatus Roizmanbacteria bacterium RIFCSPLOWO2_01_FULL_35_13 TaxID=1802055 RepID=A0A1F7I9M2_9BACT|nr:MAG: hypothetical protein A2767_01020 [Candidatus Roizmanbacteria bacterium RIFCSPHIGHO2_01_FULL_35_10]OGK40012.1 MAG: hypothetical protein A3A74_06870 [Candidatus Roizmanbacteria bacterium RIFCSPLOWO2_01_FULL_35_13]